MGSLYFHGYLFISSQISLGMTQDWLPTLIAHEPFKEGKYQVEQKGLIGE